MAAKASIWSVVASKSVVFAVVAARDASRGKEIL
jgi:hypothetical protein